jgi:hypothetical protein
VKHATGPQLRERVVVIVGFFEIMEEEQDLEEKENEAPRLQLRSRKSALRREILDLQRSGNKITHENRGQFPRQISYTRTFRRPKIGNRPK